MAWMVVVVIHEKSEGGYNTKIIKTGEAFDSFTDADKRREDINKNGYKDYDVVQALIDRI